MRKTFLIALLSCATKVAFAGTEPQHIAPEFTHSSPTEWINSEPLTLKQLRGKPVLVEFWTFDCINCLRSIDWMKSIAQRKSGGLAIVAAHTPELAHERVERNVRDAVKKLHLDYPVMLDRDFSYWRALNNQYWPAFYLIDKEGRIRSQIFGELHVGDARTLKFEREVERVLAE